ncbi:hypothetical protein V2G26_003912 [Clonostachys chloroleuca]
MSVGQIISEFKPPKPKFTEDNVPDLSGNVYLITGATGGVGLELAKILYKKNGRVYILGRSPAIAQDKIDAIKREYSKSEPTGDLIFLYADLSDLSTIKPSVTEFMAMETKLNTVWYNAGIMNPPENLKTAQGHELQWGTNVVGHFLLNSLLTPIFLSTAKTPGIPTGSVRTVWVSSDSHSFFSPKPDGINWSDINYTSDRASSMVKYGQSKAACSLLALENAARLGQDNIISVSLNPGHLKSDLNRHAQTGVSNLLSFMLYPPYFGALTELAAGFSPDVSLNNNGAYLIPWGRIGKMNSSVQEGWEKRDSGRRLWDILEKDVELFK